MDQDVTDTKRTQNTRAWGGQVVYRRKLQGEKTGKLEGEGIGWGLMRVENILVLDWGRSEMAVNSSLED